MNTAWVVHPVREDLSAALRYGTLRYVTDGYCYPDQLIGHDGDQFPDAIISRMQFSASLFDPDSDYLVMIGDHAQLLMFAVFIAQLNPDSNSIRVLRYDRQAQGYISIRFPIIQGITSIYTFRDNKPEGIRVLEPSTNGSRG